ncbi:MAG: hypothetical protein NTW45_14115 [Rhodocyclales bacterium]|nr:hypothetical protein [Rhodocyclales bacterium]
MKLPRPSSPYCQRRLLYCLAALALPASAADDAADFGWTTRLVGEGHELRRGSPFAAGLELTNFGRDRYRVEQELRGRAGPVSLLLTATESGQEGAKPAGRFVANEAFADFSAGGERFTAGKKVLSGDVGYAFRPIDVLQRENRMQMMPPQLEGIPMLSWDNFSPDGAWSVVIANPGHQRRGEAREDGSVALKLYRRVAAADFHGVLRNSKRYGLEAGAAASVVPSDALELHASLLVQRRGERRVPLADNASLRDLLTADSALATETIASPRKVLLGGTWTTEGGFSVLGEFWWDGTAPAATDWQRLKRQAAQRAALLGLSSVPAAAVAGATAASTRMFDQGNLAQHGMLTRLAWSDPGGRWSASADLLKSMGDGGWTLTTAVGWQGEKLRVDAGLRRYGGPADSAYRLLPERAAAFVGLSLAY